MGYYSELAIDDTYREDHSYPSPELQLKWRIEDLRNRLEDISRGNMESSHSATRGVDIPKMIYRTLYCNTSVGNPK